MTIVASLQLNLDVTVDSDCDAENFINWNNHSDSGRNI